MGGVAKTVSKITGGLLGGGDDKAKKAQRAAEARAAELQKQQEAIQQRTQIREDTREQELSAQDAAQRRAITARRRGSSALAFTGPTTQLKNTLGG